MGKTPDTRNKLESVKVPKKKKVRESSIKQLKQLKTNFDLPSLKELDKKIFSKKSRGQIFKETHGFSRSIARAMKKNGFHITESSYESYKKLRGDRKKEAKKIAQDKRSVSRVVRKSGGNKTSKKKQQ